MFPADRNPVPTSVEYDSRGSRAVRTLPDMYAARRFFTKADRMGLHPSFHWSDAMSTVETIPTTEAPKLKKSFKKKVAKKVAKAKAVVAKPEQHEIRWSEKKLCLLRTLKQAGATDSANAISIEKIEKLSKGKALTTLNPKFDITEQGYIAVAQTEDSRQLNRYITKKGLAFLAKQG
jgi:hypothetical protein